MFPSFNYPLNSIKLLEIHNKITNESLAVHVISKGDISLLDQNVPYIFNRRDGLIVIVDDVGQDSLNPENGSQIYFHGHTLGFSPTVLAHDEIDLFIEDCQQAKNLILTQIKNVDPSKILTTFKNTINYILGYVNNRIAQTQRLKKSKQKSSHHESDTEDAELKKLEYEKITLNVMLQAPTINYADVDYAIKRLTEIKSKKKADHKELRKSETRSRKLLATENTSAWILGDKKNVIFDYRFRDTAFIPVEKVDGDGKKEIILLNAWSTNKNKCSLTPSLSAVPPKRYVMANCLFAGALQGKTTDGKKFSLINHSLVISLSEGQKICEVHHSSQWSPYEMVMFALFEKQLKFINAVSGKIDPIIHYHLPEPSYVLSELELIIKNKLKNTAQESYSTAIKERSAAHRTVIETLATEAGIKIEIGSPFDNLGDITEFIKKNFEKDLSMNYQESLLELKIVNIILQALRDNSINITHRDAWRKILPENIVQARAEKKKLPATIEELQHLSNSMMIAIANQAQNADNKKDFEVCAFHSWDEKPIANNYNKSLASVFGDCRVIEVFPNVLYYDNTQDNNLFRVTPETAEQIHEPLMQAINEHFKPRDTLRNILGHVKKSEHTVVNVGVEAKDNEDLLKIIQSDDNGQAVSRISSSFFFNPRKQITMEQNSSSVKFFLNVRGVIPSFLHSLILCIACIISNLKKETNNTAEKSSQLKEYSSRRH